MYGTGWFYMVKVGNVWYRMVLHGKGGQCVVDQVKRNSDFVTVIELTSVF